MKIKDFVDQYRIRWGEFEYWAPYWIGRPWYMPYSLKESTPAELAEPLQSVFDANPHLFGKNTARQIAEAAERILARYPYQVNTPEEVRYILIRNAIGVDCSSFIYHVIDGYLQETRQTFYAKHLVIRKEEVLRNLKLQSWKSHASIAKNEITDLPELIDLTEIGRLFQRDPHHITDVKRLISHDNSVQVKSLEKLREGDLLYMVSEHGDHLALVLANDGQEVVFAGSYSDPVGPGGIEVNRLLIPKGKPFTEATISRSGLQYRLRDIRRPNVLL